MAGVYGGAGVDGRPFDAEDLTDYQVTKILAGKPAVNEAVRLATGSSPGTSCAVLPGPYLVRPRKIYSPVLGQ
jgi:hypothetical protein